MDDENQSPLPDSFIALFLDGRRRLTATRVVIAARYELCEDMATMLTEHCHTVHFDTGADEHDILLRCHRGLLAAPATVESNEAEWVIRRTAELLGWDWSGPEAMTPDA